VSLRGIVGTVGPEWFEPLVPSQTLFKPPSSSGSAHLALVGLVHEVQVPLRDALQARVAARAEAAQQVQRRRRLVVRLDQPVRRGSYGMRSKITKFGMHMFDS